MAVRRNIQTGAYELDIEYKQKDWGAEFVIPSADAQNSSLTFSFLPNFLPV